jgi:hypothetical protein
MPPEPLSGNQPREPPAGRADSRNRVASTSMRAPEVEAAWAALAGASACLGGLIPDLSGVWDDAIGEPERTQVKAALLDARAARDELADRLHKEALSLGVALFDSEANRGYSGLLELRDVVKDGLAGADGLAEVLSLNDPGGELVALASRLRDGFEALTRALPHS